MSKPPTLREQVDVLKVENDALLEENKAVLLQLETYKKLIEEMLEDTRISSGVRQAYTQAYVRVVDN